MSEKLRKLLRLLGSDKPAEALAAFEAVKHEMAKCGIDWHDLADAVPGQPQQATRSSFFADVMADAFADAEERMADKMGAEPKTWQHREQQRRGRGAWERWAKTYAKICAHCGDDLVYTHRATRRYCSTRCRMAAHRARRAR